MKKIIDKLNRDKHLTKDEWIRLIENYQDVEEYAKKCAYSIKCENFGDGVYIRGLIEISNYCKNDCLYCGIRRSNKNVCRYRLEKRDIMNCCAEGYDLGFRTFVMQGGEDAHFSDEVLEDIIKSIKNAYPDCAVTLSLGERTKESYQRLYNAGADRYLLRHETINNEHYEKLHPEEMKLATRVEALKNLKEIGFQTGCGFMVGSPYQTVENIAEDMMFISEFKPHMVGIGPFLKHKDTPFSDKEDGSPELTVFLLSLLRIMLPRVLLPATTALATKSGEGRKDGLLAGANVVMPNLSPLSVRKKYMLYDNKIATDTESAEGLERLKKEVESIGMKIEITRGDSPFKRERKE